MSLLIDDFTNGAKSSPSKRSDGKSMIKVLWSPTPKRNGEALDKLGSMLGDYWTASI